ncbi:MAG TPA: hypothetical protein VH092_10760, partial [Urbifossiella sp.]|nr:hypothetical protein [Urbifossiella sp.]
MPALSRPRLAAERLEARDVPAAWPGQLFAPYVNVALDFSADYAAAAQQGNFRYLTLGFVDATAGGATAWDGVVGAELGSGPDNQVQAAVAGLRAAGGDVMVSFGGDTEGSPENELAVSITNPAALQAAYQQVIDGYSLTHIDFDIEGDKMLAQPGSPASIDRRSQAIAGLQTAAAGAGKELDVYLTLAALGRPDMGQGALLPDSLAVVDSALAHGVKLAGVNLMTMDYGDGEVHEMGDDATIRGTALFGQLKTELQKWGQYTS